MIQINDIDQRVWNEITYPIPNFNCATLRSQTVIIPLKQDTVNLENHLRYWQADDIPDSKLRWSHVWPTWILSAPRWSNVGPARLAIWDRSLGWPQMADVSCMAGYFVTRWRHDMGTFLPYWPVVRAIRMSLWIPSVKMCSLRPLLSAPKRYWIKTIWCSCDVTAIAHITDRYKPNWLFLVMNNWNCSVIQNIDLFWMTDMLLITLIYTFRWIKMILIYFNKSLKFVTSLQHVNIAFSNNLTLSISIYSCHTFPLNSCIWVTVNSLWPSMARYLKCCSNFQRGNGYIWVWSSE